MRNNSYYYVFFCSPVLQLHTHIVHVKETWTKSQNVCVSLSSVIGACYSPLPHLDTCLDCEDRWVLRMVDVPVRVPARGACRWRCVQGGNFFLHVCMHVCVMYICMCKCMFSRVYYVTKVLLKHILFSVNVVQRINIFQSRETSRALYILPHLRRTRVILKEEEGT